MNGQQGPRHGDGAAPLAVDRLRGEPARGVGLTDAVSQLGEVAAALQTLLTWAAGVEDGCSRVPHRTTNGTDRQLVVDLQRLRAYAATVADVVGRMVRDVVGVAGEPTATRTRCGPGIAPAEPRGPAHGRRTATDRERAAVSRHQAGLDLDAARAERQRAEVLRQQAGADRAEATRERSSARDDALTGVLGRGAGLAALGGEMERCRRTGSHLVVAFADVDGLKAVNDTRGHAAGDDLLRQVAVALRTSLRPYDIVMRLGGDEFVYTLADASLAVAHKRFDALAALLAESAGGASVTVGMAELRPEDSPEGLVARADRALYRQRHLRAGPP